jgi:hypothetical protein
MTTRIFRTRSPETASVALGQIIKNIADTARKAGATSLRIQVTIANETLYEVLKSVTV